MCGLKGINASGFKMNEYHLLGRISAKLRQIKPGREYAASSGQPEGIVADRKDPEDSSAVLFEREYEEYGETSPDIPYQHRRPSKACGDKSRRFESNAGDEHRKGRRVLNPASLGSENSSRLSTLAMWIPLEQKAHWEDDLAIILVNIWC